MVRLGLGVDGGTFVFDISDVTVVVVGGVGHCLDAAVGKVDGVGPGHHLGVTVLIGSEIRPGIFISDSILVRVRMRLPLLLNIGWSGAIGRRAIRHGRGCRCEDKEREHDPGGGDVEGKQLLSGRAGRRGFYIRPSRVRPLPPLSC